MINTFILDYIKNNLKDEFNNSSSLTYNSSVEESLKLLLFKAQNKGPLVVVKENVYSANALYEMLRPYFEGDELVLFTPEESMRSEAIVASFENRALRLNTLYQIRKNIPEIIITTAYGLIRHLPKKEIFDSYIKEIKVNDILEKEDLINYLNSAGYENVLYTEVPLTYSSKGSIVDVYSVNYAHPIRIEFFDDEIDSIRFFDVNTKRTIEAIDSVTLISASDIYIDDEDLKDIEEELAKYNSPNAELDLDYLRNHIFAGNLYYYYAFIKHNDHLIDYFDHCELIISNSEAIDAHLRHLRDETFEYLRENAEEYELPLRFKVFGEYDKEIIKAKKYIVEPFKEVFPLIEAIDLANLPINAQIKALSKIKHKYQIICIKQNELNELREALKLNNLIYKETKDKIYEGINLVVSDINEGFEVKKLDLIVYTSKELFNTKVKLGRYARKYEEATKLNSYDELHRGDFVVHNQYGIGQYVGIENRIVNNIKLDYLKILYRGNDELLVPLSQFSLVRKYVSKEGAVPKLHKLGSKEWTKTKEKVAQNIDDLAERLVALYSSRNEKIGYAYSKDNEITKEFDDNFAYELTKDQAKAIKEVRTDMEDAKPMDRLICGDVGFGKTEVAMRAAIKAVIDHKQVAYLCPTTILSMQHFKTFKKRFREFPVRIEILNRYIDAASQKKIIKDINDGLVDIVIGTHRILSKDIKFKDLGLLIIDEEQRFGVEQKEKIKEFKESIDVLSLSATPIPRTLQMSLVGLRGLSTLDTAPQNRYPVQTYVVQKSRGLIKEVIERELSRKGQVFYLYNNVDHIYNLANQIAKDVKGARVMVAHGKMSSDELEDVMKDFYEARADVLICTTIIETGVDIPNANTIVIDNAQNFGLSQLYQIKGRVGRSDRIAYAYLMVPPKKQLSEISLKRLNAIKEFTALGSGYKIAMRDLSIRGAGDMLGAKQSGFIDNVGLDLYLSMLENAIKEKRGEKVEIEEIKAKPIIPIESYIPEDFSKNDFDKLNLYHRLEKIDNRHDLLDYYLEVTDEFGHLPKSVEALFDKKQIELLLDLNYLESLKIIKKEYVVTLSKEFSDLIDGMKLFEYISELSKDIKVSYVKQKIEFKMAINADRKKLLKLLENLDEVKRCV